MKVDGTATLFLRTHVPAINMRNHTVRVSDAGAFYWDRLGTDWGHWELFP